MLDWLLLSLTVVTAHVLSKHLDRLPKVKHKSCSSSINLRLKRKNKESKGNAAETSAKHIKEHAAKYSAKHKNKNLKTG